MDHGDERQPSGHAFHYTRLPFNHDIHHPTANWPGTYDAFLKLSLMVHAPVLFKC